MNYNKILKAIDEGIKTSLIDFKNDHILKSSLIYNNIDMLCDKINSIINNDAKLDINTYKELCKTKNIGLYEVNDVGVLDKLLGNIILSFPVTKHNKINLNWIDVSPIRDSIIFDIEELNTVLINKIYLVDIDILFWNIINLNEYTFSGENYISSIKLPLSLISIGDCAFYNCKNLKKVYIPNSVKSIGYEAFYECNKLKTIIFDGSKEEWSTLMNNSNNIFSYSLLSNNIKVVCNNEEIYI